MGMVKLCSDANPASLAASEAFTDADIKTYGLKDIGRDRVLIFRQDTPTRKCKTGDLWYNANPDHQGERLHEYSAKRKTRPFVQVTPPG